MDMDLNLHCIPNLMENFREDNHFMLGVVSGSMMLSHRFSLALAYNMEFLEMDIFPHYMR